MAKSLAVWVSDANTNALSTCTVAKKFQSDHDTFNGERTPKPEIELHFNYWSLNSKKQNRKFKKTKIDNWFWPASWIANFIILIKDNSKKLLSYMKEMEPIAFLDVGVKFSKVEGKDINIYLPFNITKEDYDGGLGNLVANDVGLLSVIFNEEVKRVKFDDGHYHYSDVDFENDENLRFFTNIDLSETNELGNGVKLGYIGQQGCFLTFPSSLFKLESSQNGYFRFRIILNGTNQKSICIPHIPKDRFLLSSEERIDMVDFRVNEIRNMPDNINRYISDGFILKKVHFFIIREVDSEFVMANTDYDRCRLLEGDLWKRYLQTNKLHSIQKIPNMLIFHWKSKSQAVLTNSTTTDNNVSRCNACGSYSKNNTILFETAKIQQKNSHYKGIHDFSAFAKFSYRKQSSLIIMRSVLLALGFSLFANYLSGQIEKWAKIWEDSSQSSAITNSSNNQTVSKPSTLSAAFSATTDSQNVEGKKSDRTTVGITTTAQQTGQQGE